MTFKPVPGSLRPLTCSEVRDIDVRAVRDFGLPSIVLMENAGRNCTELLVELGISGPVVICAGKGNNGGDGLVIARHLRNRGVDVRLLLFASPAELKGDAAINYRILKSSGWEGECIGNAVDGSGLLRQFASAEWIVDALLGTGSKEQLREPLSTVVTAINESQRKVFAVDLPTGLDADTGLPGPVCVRAHHTATFVAPKIGFNNPSAIPVLGNVHVVDIGIPSVMLDSKFRPHSTH